MSRVKVQGFTVIYVYSVGLEHVEGRPMNTPSRVRRALAKYGIQDEKLNSRLNTAVGSPIELEGVYVDIEV